MLAIAAELDLNLYMMDVRTTFLNADVEQEIFVKMLPGYKRSNKAGVSLVMELQNSLYGLRQRSKNWFGAMD